MKIFKKKSLKRSVIPGRRHNVTEESESVTDARKNLIAGAGGVRC